MTSWKNSNLFLQGIIDTREKADERQDGGVAL